MDFVKALDSVSFDFIGITLEIFNFVPVYKNWINIIFEQTVWGYFSNVTIFNGHISEKFPGLQGYRLVDQIAGYLFIICIEVMVLLKRNSEIQGYETKKSALILNDLHAVNLTGYFWEVVWFEGEWYKTQVKIVGGLIIQVVRDPVWY